MLRAQAFEGLFTLVPILLVVVISILLRARAARRRKRGEEAATGAAARAEGTKPSEVSRPAGAGQTSPTGLTRGAVAQAPGRPVPSKRERAATRAAAFPWQRESAEVYPQRPKGPTSAAPFAPQQPRRAQVTSRESYAYPPPLGLNDSQLPQADETRPRGPAIPRPVIRPSVESRMAVERMASVNEGQDLRQRMETRDKAYKPAAEEKAGQRYSITARLERLPPLKRAVIWAEILGPPGGRQ